MIAWRTRFVRADEAGPSRGAPHHFATAFDSLRGTRDIR
jgi:hypothetical protein